jgi:ATP-dependent Lon protease
MAILTPDGERVPIGARLPVLPLRDVVFFPYIVMPLLVGRRGSLAAVDAALGGEGGTPDGDGQYLLAVTQRNADADEPAAGDLYRVGVVARILQRTAQPNGATKLLLEGVARARVTRYAFSGGVMRATLAASPIPTGNDASAATALARRVMSQFEEYVALQRRIPGEVVSIIQSAPTPFRRALAIAAHLSLAPAARQKLLEASTLDDLLHLLDTTLTGEIELLGLEQKIEQDVRGSLFQNQREFYLQEQLKAIHRELGQEDDDLVELEAQVERKGLPEPVKARVLREIRKMRRMSPIAPESTVSRNFVDWVLALPWTARTDDVLDVAHARRILDEDHYGLEPVKDRILDYIGVLSLVGRMEGPILCLVGPPGVGKTSLGRSVARALGRKFVRMSLGGVRDEAEIRGHRRTYIGSMPGRMLQAMRRADVMNPVILLDEVDKLGQDYRGDPGAALLEVLDPEQNRAFNDHYLELDYDLSQVLFITTANYLPRIPEPLRDRMEVIRLPGYLDQEKLAIARQFLVPKQLRANGVSPDTVTWEPDVLPAIIHEHTREAGVRELERKLARVARKLARRRAESHGRTEGPDVVRAADLKELLGPAPFDPTAVTLEDKVGVAMGLAYSAMGGDVLEIEVSVVPGRGRLQLTGTLGDVMKESASAALSYTRSRSSTLGIDRRMTRTRDLHIHIPDGATPKDGPSAGIAMATAIASALTGVPVRGDIAMTGEVTLRGRVLPIGGLREKAVAAHRNRIYHVIIPQQNVRDVEELPAEVRDAVHFHPVKTMDEVLRLALTGGPYAGDAPSEAALRQ